ncbi:MAG: 2-succinyl-5-enolpyruvyl-6-hydroxy-3-cyclohexene-1-carboxylic-acid synthase [Longimicrobiales bacterium]|nr:2-succinyl-5-enolpyruvyl-6-hydroxy-3-cyclohexene-1-carboxylic-acid synthase [Longimicrobiales bacterium]
MTPPAPNALWARALVQELERAGVREVCLAPGSRSTPLALELATRPGLTVRVFLDERAAAYFALGVGKATGVPAAVLTTSGTAVANLLPAVVEAHQAEVPLLLLTADRPRRLRDADANQTIRQAGIFAAFVREAWDLPEPRAEEEALRHLRTVAVRAVASAVGDPPGPVHLNVPFAKPLEPAIGGDAGVASPDELGPETFRGVASLAAVGRGSAPLTRVSPRRFRAGAEDVEALAARLAAAERPLLVAGVTPRPSEVGAAVLRCAAACGVPVLADPLSGARTCPPRGATRAAAYDLYLRSPEVRAGLVPDLVVRVGAAPTSAALAGWLEALASVPQVVVDAGARWKDHQNAASDYLRADPAEVLGALTDRGGVGAAAGGATGWRARWAAVDRAALDAALRVADPPHEGLLAARVMAGTPAECALFVSSSMPIRDVDAFGGVRDDGLPVFGNRGASGIDGIVSTAAGVAAGARRRVVALLGDLAFLHDANGLLALREEGVDVTLVVVNNDGGGIFHMLPVRAFEPPFTRLFATPHGLDLSHLARMHGIPHLVMEDPREGSGVLEEALAAPGSRLVEVRTEREANRIGHEAAVAAAVAAARAALNDLME